MFSASTNLRGRAAILTLLLALLLTVSGALAQEQITPPQNRPDTAAGLEIYADRCANCHGPLGLGDGELAAQSLVPPTVLASPDYLRNTTPATIFATITNGIFGDAGPIMPPFGPASSNPISEAGRWNLVAAVYSLGTPTENVAAGETLYDENCAACHGPAGDQLAAVNLAESAYWLHRSNADLFAALSSGDIPAHDYDLSEDALWQVVDYARTLSYAYADPRAALAPIPQGTVSGAVHNATRNETVTEPLTVTLSAFTSDVQVALTETTTLAADGTFTFTVNDVAPDLVYVATLRYNGIQFGSDFGQLERDDPALDLPLTVYETTTDPAGIRIGQLHVVLDFGPGTVTVNELYQFSNESDAVFVGPTGDAAAGTVEISLPAGAENPQFTRTFGSLENFFPAEDLLRTATGWAETVAVRPGQSTLNLLVRYTLPYETELSLAHPVHYPVDNANLVLGDVGVRLEDVAGEWLAAGTQDIAGETFLTFSRSAIPAGDEIRLPLSGRPQRLTDAAGNTVPATDQTPQLLASLGLLLLVAAGVAYYVTRERRRHLPVGVATAGDVPGRREALLQALADLDDAYQEGELPPEHYTTRRQALKEQLAAIWSNDV